MTTEASAVVDLVKQIDNNAVKPFLMDAPEGRTFMATPKVDHNGNVEWKAEQITSTNKAELIAPKIVTQAVKLQDARSMIEYLNRFKNADSALFADIDSSTVHAIVDYHQMPPANMDVEQKDEAAKAVGATNDYTAKAQHTKHTATLIIPPSIEWQTWMGIDGQLMSHVAFATFLEENQQDIQPLAPITNPDGSPVEDAPSSLLELCRELQIKSTYGANSAVRSGDYTNIEFQKGDDIATKRNVALPLSFGLQIPVYFNEISVPITAFMRRRVDDGVLKLGIKLQRPEEIRQQEFHRIVGNIAGAVELTTLYGKPA